MRKPVHILFAIALITASAAGEGTCQLDQITSLDIQSPIRPMITARVNSHPVNLLVDTGGFMTMLTENKAEALGLETHPIKNPAGSFYGGYVVKNYADIDTLRLGTLQAGKSSYPLMPPIFSDPDENGIIAPDFLANFDLDFDFAKGKLNLFSKKHCEGHVVYWTQTPYAKIPMIVDNWYHIVVNVELDGLATQAIIDTGATNTVMSLDFVQRNLRIGDDDPKLTKTGSPNGLHNSRRYPFKHLKIGDVSVENPDITLVPDSESKEGECPVWAKHTFCEDPPPITLGMSVLKRLHLYIDYHEKQLYLTDANAR